MEWFNIYGLTIILIIMIPNIVYAIKCKQGFENVWSNRLVETFEQIGRIGCLGFMVINIPGTWYAFASNEMFALYLIVNSVLLLCYCLIWILMFNKNTVFKALALSILPSVLFLFCGITSRSILLVASAVIFAPSHIMISYKNVKTKEQ